MYCLRKSEKTRLLASVCIIILTSLLLVGCSVAKALASTSTASFGYAQIGNLSNSTFQGLYLSNFTSPGDVGNITRIEIYMATGGCTAQAVMYSDVDGAPVALLYVGSAVNVGATTGGWISFDFNYTALPKFSFWIGVVFQSAATYYYTSNVNETAIYSSSTPMAANLCPSGSVIAGDALSVFAVYTPTVKANSGTASYQTLLIWIIVVGIILAIIIAAASVLSRQKNNDQEKKNPERRFQLSNWVLLSYFL